MIYICTTAINRPDLHKYVFEQNNMFFKSKYEFIWVINIDCVSNLNCNYDETKENFIETILPKIAENVKEDFTPHAVAWSSECWMRQADKDKPIENWKKLSNGNKNVFKVVGSAATSGFVFYAGEILLGMGWVAITGTPPPAAIGMVLRSGRVIASGGL